MRRDTLLNKQGKCVTKLARRRIFSPVLVHMLLRWCSMTSILTQTPTSWRFYHRSLVHPSGIQPSGGERTQEGCESTVARKAHNSTSFSFIWSNSGPGMEHGQRKETLDRVWASAASCCQKLERQPRQRERAEKNREKEKSCFVPVAPLIWGELGNASRIKCYFHSFSPPLPTPPPSSLQDQIK